MMLTIIQCETMEEASQQLASLHEQIGKISESISESHREVAVQLRELIGQRHDAENETSAVSIHPTTHQATSTEYSLHISPPSTTVSNNSRFDGIDSASIRTTSSFLTIRSVRSLIPSWSEELKKSRPYKRLWRHSSSSSVFSKDSSATKGVTWSMLSNMSLGDLPISEISVLELPISPSDLYDPIPYQQWVGHKQIRQEVNWSRLEGAIDNYNPYAFQALLNLGTDPGKEEVVYSPLPVSETSCRYHGIAFCKLLLDLQVDRKDFDGSTPLSLAAVHATDFSGRTPLSHAAKLGIFSVCKLLLDRGAMVDAADYSGRTPLSYAAWYGHIHICELLLDRGANVDTADCGGRTTLSYSVRRHVYEDLCVLLLNRGAAVDAADSSGRTPLSHGVGLGTVSLCELLLRWGAAVNSTDSNGRTPLSYCAELNGHSYVCALLLDWGGKVDLADFKGRTPLSYSTERGVSSISRKLLDRGANADAADFKGHTPLWYAQSWGEESEIYEMLWMFRCLCANQTTVDVDRDNRPINDSVE
ncbi:ankyrin repeat-containing domain protein [Tirmania nivea]|nr:ankyrin repeat-containing domain protein [Tirmania nivea]